ncbi:hypothetical protein ECDEC3F_3159 [Escherichia coli DEC3F]
MHIAHGFVPQIYFQTSEYSFLLMKSTLSPDIHLHILFLFLSMTVGKLVYISFSSSYI